MTPSHSSVPVAIKSLAPARHHAEIGNKQIHPHTDDVPCVSLRLKLPNSYASTSFTSGSVQIPVASEPEDHTYSYLLGTISREASSVIHSLSIINITKRRIVIASIVATTDYLRTSANSQSGCCIDRNCMLFLSGNALSSKNPFSLRRSRLKTSFSARIWIQSPNLLVCISMATVVASGKLPIR